MPKPPQGSARSCHCCEHRREEPASVLTARRATLESCGFAGAERTDANRAIGYLLRVAAADRGRCPFFVSAQVPADAYRADDGVPLVAIEEAAHGFAALGSEDGDGRNELVREG